MGVVKPIVGGSKDQISNAELKLIADSLSKQEAFLKDLLVEQRIANKISSDSFHTTLPKEEDL